MSWLEGRLPKWGRFGREGTGLLEREETPESAVPNNTGPRLMILVNDASGMACFKTHAFSDAESATDFILYWFRHDKEGFNAFWALTQEPSPGVNARSRAIAEPLVMIRDAQRVDVVYSFSFVDIESAQSFARDEVGSGTDLGQMMLYWAVPVSVTTEAGGKITLTPSVPPGAVSDEESETETTGDLTAKVELPREPHAALEAYRVFREAPNAHTGVANGMSVGEETFELTSWIERASKKRSGNQADDRPAGRSSYERAFETPERRAETFFESPVAIDETLLVHRTESFDSSASLRETITQEPAPTSESPLVADAFESIADEPATELEEEKREDESVTDALEENRVAEAFAEEHVEPAEPPPVEIEDQMQLDELAEDRREALVDDSEADVQAVSPSAQTEADSRADELREPSDGSENGFVKLDPIEIIVHTNGHSKIEPAEPPSEVAESPEATIAMQPEETDDDDTDQSFNIRIDIHFDAARALKVKRWGLQENPFQGFKSPPGRF